MAAPSEIEKLERRYAENPDGRFFAPLADAYRKSGNVLRALELVRAGLAKHPDYLSAHIVLGRCLLDKGDDAEAEATFRSVLNLDAENIIALKSLAEITERTGRVTEARQWLQKLLAVDSMNVEAEADLQRLGGVIAQQPTQEMEPVQPAGVSFADLAHEVEAPAAAAAPAPEPVVAPAPPASTTIVAEPPPVPVPAAPVAAQPEPVPPPVMEPVAAAPPPAPPMPEPVAAFEPPAPPAAPPMAAYEPPAPEPLPSFEPLPAAEPVATPEPVASLEEAAPAVASAAEATPSAEAAEPLAAAAPEGFLPISEVAAGAEVGGEPVPDRHPLQQELQVSDAGLELMPFDDSLAWGTGERSSRAIRAEDIASVEHDDALTTPAVEFLAQVESAAAAEPAAPQAAAPEAAGTAPEEFAVERQEEVYFGSDAPPPPPPNVDLPADLSGAYSIIDMPEALPEQPLAAPIDTALHPSPGLPLIMPEDVTPASELSRPSAKLVQMVSPAPPEEGAGPTEQPMLTETLGDLYLSQGFKGEAADVYRKLLSQRPADDALRAKLRAVEAPPADLSAAALGAESVGVWLSRVAAARLPGPASPLGAAEPTPGPSPLEAAFAAPAEPAGEPAHPANDAFSLDQIFGSSGEAPAPPAPPAGEASAPATPPPGASFDEFFGAPPEAGSVRPVARATDAPAQPGDEDLSAFNAWLQGLKR